MMRTENMSLPVQTQGEDIFHQFFFGEKLQAMVRYIYRSHDEHVVNKETIAMDEIIRRVKVNMLSTNKTLLWT